MQQALQVDNEHHVCSGQLWRVIFFCLLFPFFQFQNIPVIVLYSLSFCIVTIRKYVSLNQESSVNFMSLHDKSFPEVCSPIGVVGTWQITISQCAAIYKLCSLTFSLELLLYLHDNLISMSSTQRGLQGYPSHRVSWTLDCAVKNAPVLFIFYAAK